MKNNKIQSIEPWILILICCHYLGMWSCQDHAPLFLLGYSYLRHIDQKKKKATSESKKLFYSVWNFWELEAQEAASQIAWETSSKEAGKGVRWFWSLSQGVGSLENQRLLLVKENQISQKFSTLLCTGSCKCLGSVKSFLSHASQLSGTSTLLLDFSHHPAPSFSVLTGGAKGHLTVTASQAFVLPSVVGRPPGSRNSHLEAWNRWWLWRLTTDMAGVAPAADIKLG